MNNKKLLLAGATIISLVIISLIISSNKSNSQRADYEQFLTEEYSNFPFPDVTEIGDEPAMDRPDLASFTDYIKTMDPELKVVPTWRLADGLERSESLREMEGFKSGSSDLQWTAHPTDMGGRTRSLMFDPNDPSHSKVWAGSVTGGLWVSDDPFHNTGWRPVNDFWPNLSISTITYDPNDTNTFYLGTGESQTALIIYRESSGRGSGIYTSKDAGETWEVIPSTKDWAYVTDILVRDEDGQSVIYAGVVSGKYKGGDHQSAPTDGLYRSTDAGESWTQVLPLINGESVPYAPSDIQTSSDNSRIFIGTTYNLDGKGASCILQSDDGINWTVDTSFQQEILNGHTISGNNRTYTYPGRVMFSDAPSNPDIMYALVAGGYIRSDLFVGYDCVYILKSVDKGQTWENMTIPMRGGSNTFAYLAWHALVIEVSPINPNLIWIGGLDTWRTSDGGENWTIQSDWSEMYGNGSANYVHADIHAFVFRPGSDTDMLIATDGGIFGTTSASSGNPGFLEFNQGYSSLQYYSGAIHPDAGAVHFLGGLQDNGTMFYKKNNVPTFRDMLSGGDGALCFIDQNNPGIHLTTVYHTSVYLYNAAKEEDPQYRGGKSFNTGTFINAMDFDWRDNYLFANGEREEGTNPNSIVVASVSANSVNGSLKDVPTQSEVPYSCLKWSEHSPQGKSTLFIGTQAGKLFKLEDAVNVGDLTDITGDDFPTGLISSIDIGQSEDTLLVTFSNYGVASVWLSVDGGQNWQDKQGDLPDMPVRWALFHPENSDQVMLATELGTWTTTKVQSDMVIWSPRVDGMANVRVDQIKLRKSDNTVLAATHGRGMYTGIWNVDFTTGIEKVEMLASDINIFPNPSQGEFQIEFQNLSSTSLTITDLAGRIVFQEKVETRESIVSKSIDLKDQPKGIYFVILSSSSGEHTSKILIQ